jgi:hypothetical protein
MNNVNNNDKIDLESILSTHKDEIEGIFKLDQVIS